MNRTSARIYLAIALFCGSAMASAGCQGSASHAPAESTAPVELPAVAVTLSPVVPRDVERRIAVVGTLNALETISISAKVSGRVEHVRVDVSDRVAPGAVLVEIDRTDYQLAVDETQRNLESELARLGLTELPDKSFDPLQLPVVVRSQLQLEQAQREFERNKRLAEKGATSQQDLEQTETSLRVHQASLRQIMIEVNSTLAAVRHAQTRLATANRQLSEATILAPKLERLPMLPGGGELRFTVAKRMVASGETLSSASGPILTLVIDDVLELSANVPERYLGQLKVGQAVDVQVEAYPGEIFRATISRISPVVDPESRTIEVEALVANSEHRLSSGAFAKASILTNAHEQAVTAPLEAISTFAGVTKVFAVADGVARQIPVTIGARGPGWVELIGEVDASIQVATSGLGQLADGTKVEI
ncbi:MAG TPA: efflux RND transporter periplasmic adaptor subunit, partial [Pirellulaceae bacterium]|nr:efflux RND transporter periplasmic adaptor subunit [Pirellulaceae bacterium]